MPFTLVEGIPTQLNRVLKEGAIDVSPSASIEYAASRGRYLRLPDLSITSKKSVLSILLESRVPIGKLKDKIVALPTAKATSLVLLRILREIRFQLSPCYKNYEQGVEDPAAADAVLTIGISPSGGRWLRLIPIATSSGSCGTNSPGSLLCSLCGR